MTTDGTWLALQGQTPARIGLGRVGASLPTRHHLDLQLAHARARDAVGAVLDRAGIAAGLGHRVLHLRSMAADRPEYLRRPDLGRRLDRAASDPLPPGPCDLAFVVADGLSAHAVNTQAAAMVGAVLAALPASVQVAPVCLVEQGRVAVGDEIGAALGAAVVVVLIGERPGLSAADSMGAYVTWAPTPGTLDAARNCVSNIRPGGLGVPEAGATVAAIIEAARRHRLTGVELGLLPLMHPEQVDAHAVGRLRQQDDGA